MAFTGKAFSTAVLNSTNYYRAQHQASALVWDTTLAQYAQAYAEKCIWEHSGGPYGENLASGYDSPAPAIDAWAREEKEYNYAKAKFSESTGHYTQLVWRNTTTVGCGAKQCSNAASNGVNGWYVVCEYTPRGNVEGQFREEVRKVGVGKDGKPGFGAASEPRSAGKWLGALVAVYVLLAVCV
ncbi:hypothetical protein LTR08_007526 [Meristemomyces frigidus]|nr:hypothetical protein LTR08_007526 [Meristemomyces frigidus]